MTAIETYHHTAAGGIFNLGEQILPQARCGLADNQTVHPHWTGADHAPETGGAEGQTAGKAGGQFSFITFGFKTQQLIPGFRVGIYVQPMFQLQLQMSIHRWPL